MSPGSGRASGLARLRRSLDASGASVVVASTNLVGLRPAVARELRDRLIERLDTLFPSGVFGEEIAPGRVAVPVVSHPGLDRTVDAVSGVLDYEFSGRVSLWIERPPLPQESTDEYLERLRSMTPAQAAGRPRIARVGARSSPDRQPGSVASGTLAVVAGSVAMAVFGLAIAGLSTLPSGGAGGVASALPSGSGTAPDASGDAASTRSASPGGSENGTTTTTTTIGDAVPVDGVAASSGRIRTAVETLVAAVGVGEGAARALLPESLRSSPIRAGVPELSEIREDQIVVVAFAGETPPELCSLLAARPDTVVVGDVPVCASAEDVLASAQAGGVSARKIASR